MYGHILSFLKGLKQWRLHTCNLPMTTAAANLKLRRVSRSEQYSSGGGCGLHLPQSETHLEGEGQKYCRHPIGSVTQLQRLFKALCEYCSDCIQRYFLQAFKFSFQISRFIDSFEYITNGRTQWVIKFKVVNLPFKNSRFVDSFE